FATRIPLRFIFKGLMPVWFLIGFTFILHLLVTKEGPVLLEIFTFSIHLDGLIKGLAISLRFFLLILVTSLLTLTTTPIEITDAIEDMLAPLQKIKFPVHELALMMSISLRFIPTLMQEAEKISKAQASRGVDFRTGPVKERLKAIVPLLVPLFVSSFKRAEELAMAMEARGYHGGEGRTKLRMLKIQKCDWLALGLFTLVVLSLLVIRPYAEERRQAPLARVKCTMRHDAAHASAYQSPSAKRTVQGEAEKALPQSRTGRPVQPAASGRADKGVHAKSQVFHFD